MPVVPFASVMERNIHFSRHGHEFGFATPDEYEQVADAFMFGAMNADTHECIQASKPRRNRMDFVTVHFGVAVAVAAPEVLLTFYIPRPDTVIRHGGVPGLFAHYCAR
jgi:hypothetical protein